MSIFGTGKKVAAEGSAEEMVTLVNAVIIALPRAKPVLGMRVGLSCRCPLVLSFTNCVCQSVFLKLLIYISKIPQVSLHLWKTAESAL